MDTKRIVLFSTWSSFVKQHERSEAIAGNPCVRFEILYQRYYASVLAFLRFLVGTPEVADYHVAGQDILLYEQPSALPYSSSIAKTVSIGTIQGQLFQDEAGNSALQWYQYGMECQITSRLSVDKLISLASIFQPIKSWDLIIS